MSLIEITLLLFALLLLSALAVVCDYVLLKHLHGFDKKIHDERTPRDPRETL